MWCEGIGTAAAGRGRAGRGRVAMRMRGVECSLSTPSPRSFTSAYGGTDRLGILPGYGIYQG